MEKVKIKIPIEFKELFNPRWRVLCYYGGRYSGKSYDVALAELLRGRERKMRILCTRQIQNTIRDSVHKLLKDQIEKYEFTDYQVTNDSIFNKITGTEFIFKGLLRNIQEIKSLEGIDDCWIEEGQNTTSESLDILIPTIRKPGSRIIVTYNRFSELDPVHVKYAMMSDEDRLANDVYVKQVNYDVMLKNGLLSDVIYKEILYDKTHDPATYAYKWLGEPIGQSENAIIGRVEVLKAMQREDFEIDGAIEVGVDVARMGNDRTILTKRRGFNVIEQKKYNKLRTTDTSDKIKDFVNYDKSILIKVDDTGVGGGVTDELLKDGYNVLPVNFGERAADRDKYSNRISEGWFELQSLIDRIKLPFDQDILMELTTRTWNLDSKGRRCVESKESYKKRGFRSPDIADSIILSFMRPLPPENQSVFGPVLLTGSNSRII